MIDLHVHSTASDGVFRPSEVVRLALARGLAVIALTDHDTVAGVAEAQRAATGTSLEVIAGLEINAEAGQGELHLLGYYVDPQDEPLQEHLQAMQDARIDRVHGMIEQLRVLEAPVTWEEIWALAEGNSVGRPHVGRALVERGYVGTLREAFERFIGRGGPAYVPRSRLAPRDAIRVIAGAGGVPVLAHPAHSGTEAMARIPELVGYGLRGLEVYYPDHSPADVDALLGLCKAHGLLATGGTDFHGEGRGEGHGEGAPLGSVHVPPVCLERLRAAAGRADVLA